MQKVFAYKNITDQVMTSSSGGAFIGICKAFFEKYKTKCCVVGAIFSENLDVIHSMAFCYEDCHSMKQSKYVKSQCDGDIFKKIQEKLIDGYHVLFVGTPCQVFSLKNYLKGVEHKRLFCIDIICHGTPSPKVWNAYRLWLENLAGDKMISYSFRYKPEGWKSYPAYAYFKNGIQYINTAETSVYSRLHLKGFSIQKGCFKCPFSNLQRNGDLTLGDFWGVEDYSLDTDVKDGITLILVNSENGEYWINKLKDANDIYIKEIKDWRFLKYQQNLKHSTQKPEHYDEFWKDFEKESFQSVLNKYLNYGKKYKLMFTLRKFIRKTPFINIWRRLKGRR